MSNQLSPILQFPADASQSVDIAYAYFSKNIGDRAHRPTLFDKEVFIECSEIVADRPVGFWHIVSLEEKHNFSKIVPCVNDPSIDLCNQNCITMENQIAIKYGTEIRSICLYRAARLPWIIDLIKMANRDDPAVQVWLKPGGQKANDRLYLRYNRNGNDFVVIFSVQKKFYRLISAFPVFYIRDKQDMDKDYAAYRWSYFSQ
jgi:hypothetical protein